MVPLQLSRKKAFCTEIFAELLESSTVSVGLGTSNSQSLGIYWEDSVL